MDPAQLTCLSLPVESQTCSPTPSPSQSVKQHPRGADATGSNSSSNSRSSTSSARCCVRGAPSPGYGCPVAAASVASPTLAPAAEWLDELMASAAAAGAALPVEPLWRSAAVAQPVRPPSDATRRSFLLPTSLASITAPPARSGSAVAPALRVQASSTGTARKAGVALLPGAPSETVLWAVARPVPLPPRHSLSLSPKPLDPIAQWDCSACHAEVLGNLNESFLFAEQPLEQTVHRTQFCGPSLSLQRCAMRTTRRPTRPRNTLSATFIRWAIAAASLATCQVPWQAAAQCIVTVVGPVNIEGGPGTSISLFSPQAVLLDGAGGMLISDSSANAVRRILGSNGTSWTVAGIWRASGGEHSGSASE